MKDIWRLTLSKPTRAGGKKLREVLIIDVDNPYTEEDVRRVIRDLTDAGFTLTVETCDSERTYEPRKR